MDISVVSPVYKGEKIVDKLVEELIVSLSKITQNFEILLIDDGSPDSSWEVIEKNSKKDTRVKGIKLSRNFGQHNAISAGLDVSKGNYVVVMDCDLQDNPSYISTLHEKAKEGFDIVYTQMINRKHSLTRNFYSGLYSLLFNLMVDRFNYSSSNSTYTLLTRKAVNAYRSFRDTHRHYLLILNWIGFKSTKIEIVHEKRYEGKSSYSLFKLIELAIDGIISQSDRLLRLSIGIGFCFFLLSIILVITLICLYFIYGFKEGWTSIFCMILFSSGIVLLSNGVIGIYLGKTFEQTKNRPLYLIDKTTND